MKTKYLPYFLIVFSIVAFGCAKAQDLMEMVKNGNSEFEKMCTNAGYEWMLMKPTQDGKIIKEEESCWGCMVEGIEHVCDKEKLREFVSK